MKAIRQFAWALAVVIPLAITPKALASNVFPGVGTVDYNESGNTLTLVIAYQARNPYRVQWLGSHNRLQVDVEGMRMPGNRAMVIGTGIVQQIRASRVKANVTRLTFDLTSAADLRTITDGSSRTLVLTVYPRGNAPTTRFGVPGPRPTRRPLPSARDTHPGFPITENTPNPFQPSFAPVYAGTPTPGPAPTFSPGPTPEPTFVPTPEVSPSGETSPSPETPQGEQPVFGSRFMVGAEVPINLSETYTNTSPGNNDHVAYAGGPDVGGTIDWTQMFGPYFGLGLNTHAIAYTISDDEAAADGVSVTHARTDYEISVGPRGRLPLPAGLEVYLQPGVLVRTVQVNGNATNVDSTGAPTSTTPTPLTDNSYLNSGWLGYGAQVQLGLGYKVFGPLSLAATGEYNTLLAGSMNQPGATSIFPLSGFRAGAEARLDFGLLGVQLGYNYTSNGNGTLGLSQSSTGPYVKVGVVY